MVAAHPDDETLGCGGVLAKFLERGHPAWVLFLGEGVTARYVPSEFESPKVQQEMAYRKECAVRALAVLGLQRAEVFLSLRPCCRFDCVPGIELTKEIERHILDFQPNLLFTHSPHDITGFLDRKIAALAVYDREMHPPPHPRSPRWSAPWPRSAEPKPACGMRRAFRLSGN